MKKIIVLICVLLGYGILSAYGQTALEKAMDRIGISINMPSYLHPSQNEDWIQIVKPTEEYPLPSLEQLYGDKPAYGNTALMNIFGLVNSIISSDKGDYLLFVSVSPGKGGNTYGKYITDPDILYVLNNIRFGAKGAFKWGKKGGRITEAEIMELYPLITVYPKEQAKKMFNANVMVSYPVNMQGNIYRDRYTRCRAVDIGKDRLEFTIMFMMTDESMKHFDDYLNDLDKVFWFNDGEFPYTKNPDSGMSQPYDFEVDGIYYKYVNNNMVEVTSSPNCYRGNVSIPATVNYNDTIYSVTSIKDGSFMGCSSLTSVFLPLSVKEIKPYTFLSCSSLESVIIPNSVTLIDASAFSGCSSLKSITIPSSVTQIKEFAFWECASLESIVIPNSVTSIRPYAFHGCSSLHSVIIPYSVEEIMEGAFGQCDALTSVTCCIPKPFRIDNSVFSGVKFENCTLFVPADTKEVYKATDGWSSFIMVKEK